MLPARIDELERVQLELEILRSIRISTQVRQLLAEEETEQQGLRRRIDERLGSLRHESDRLKAELERMEAAAVSWAASHLPRQPLSLRTTQAAGTLLTQQQPNRFPAASRSRTRRAQRFAPSMAASRRNLAPSGAS